MTLDVRVIAGSSVPFSCSPCFIICRDWHFGTAPGKFVSMAVSSPGCYGIPEGTMYSFPVSIADGKWSIVEGLTIDDFAREKMDATLKELTEEAADAMSVCEE